MAADWEVAAAEGKVLSDGQHLDAVDAQVAHHVEDFLIGFAEADHQALNCLRNEVGSSECL